MLFLAACHACVLMLYCIVTIVCYVCSFEWQIKFSLSLFSRVCVFDCILVACAAFSFHFLFLSVLYFVYDLIINK